MRTAIGPRNVPSVVLNRSSIPDADYADWFTTATAGTASPEEYARSMFGDSPGWQVKLVWGFLLRLRLIRNASPDSVAGYRIASRGSRWIRLEASSRSLTSNLIVATDGGEVSLATLMRYDRWPGRVRWSLLSPVHRTAAPGLLARTVVALSRSG
ncbi:hypothetical protein GCM10009691_21370 [Brevibacterium picturae]|uniref:DUF2867 domain-containing protein n=1 Tax=Brevibacterium picturae TaxID=260553 RepID=A0ABP4ML38_9MICO